MKRTIRKEMKKLNTDKLTFRSATHLSLKLIKIVDFYFKLHSKLVDDVFFTHLSRTRTCCRTG